MSSSISVFSQGSKLIIISEKVGDIIDLRERNQFRLWSSFRGFISAVIVQGSPQNILIINYRDYGKTETIQYLLSEDEYNYLKTWINNYEEIVAGNYPDPIEPFNIPNRGVVQRDKPPTKHPIVELITVDGQSYHGKLIDFENNDECLIDMDSFIKKIYLNSIQTFSYKPVRTKGKFVLLGLGIGLVVPIINYLLVERSSSKEDPYLEKKRLLKRMPMDMLIGSAIGLVGGCIVEIIRAKSGKRYFDFQKMKQDEKIVLFKRILGKV